MKILRYTHLPDNRLNEGTIGDTHSALAVSLGKVDAGMRGLGLTPAGMDKGTLGNVGSDGRAEVSGWRNLTLVFGKSEQDLRSNAPTNITEKFKKVFYKRHLGTVVLSMPSTFGGGKPKVLRFLLTNVVSDPQENEVYGVEDLDNEGLGNVHLDSSFTFMMFIKIAGSKAAV